MRAPDSYNPCLAIPGKENLTQETRIKPWRATDCQNSCLDIPGSRNPALESPRKPESNLESPRNKKPCLDDPRNQNPVRRIQPYRLPGFQNPCFGATGNQNSALDGFPTFDSCPRTAANFCASMTSLPAPPGQGANQPMGVSTRPEAAEGYIDKGPIEPKSPHLTGSVPPLSPYLRTLWHF